MTAREMVTKARAALVLDQPFFGVLALRLRVVEDPGCKTAYTDGRVLGYNPKFVESLSHHELLAVIAHEVMHCACGHPWRKSGREHGKWNHACDYAINPILVDAEFKLPEGCLNDPAFQGRSAEWIYDRLPDGQKGGKPQGGRGQGQGQGSGSDDDDDDGQGAGGDDADDDVGDPLGEVREAPADADPESQTTESEWKQAVQQAAMAARARGRLSSGLQRFAADETQPKVDWRSALRRFIQQAAKADYAWSRPNVRYLAGGLYLPGLRSEEMPPMVVAVDTSGSVDGVLLSQFASEIRSIVDEVRPQRTHVMYADAAVCRMDTFERDDVVEIKPAGGGGTDFRPVFSKAAELDDDPVCVVYLTDLEGEFPDVEPDVPTLWVVAPWPGHTPAPAPFGETIFIG